MISKKVNLSTGPVGITRQVQQAFQEPPISHRSPRFRRMFDATTALLSKTFGVRETFLLTGSGTLANEAMLQEIKTVPGKGLILSNGEFGDRLIIQASRNNMDFLTYRLEWGDSFNMGHIESLLSENSITWLLCCHCETSTGMIIDIKRLVTLATLNNCLCFIDCMSSSGTQPLDLSGVAMASISSGKGLASIAGLAIVMSNIELAPKPACPIYLDLHHYRSSLGIPFTIPSNLLKALYTSVIQKLSAEQYHLIAEYRRIFFNALNDYSLVPFSNEHSAVFTIVPPNPLLPEIIDYFVKSGLAISYESEYLKKRSWCQLATLGYYTEEELKLVSVVLSKIGTFMKRNECQAQFFSAEGT